MASGFSPAVPGSFPRADPVRSIAGTVALVPVMLQFFHFFPASNHFPNGLILAYYPRYVPQIYNLSSLPSVVKYIIKIT